MNLSKNFTLEEFLVSQTAERHGIDMTPSTEIKINLTKLVTEILQPLRDEVGSAIFISSGYRPEDLNSLINGSKTSAHRFGCAADFKVAGQTPLITSILIREMDLPYDQVIHEFGRWVHVGIHPNNDIRRQELTAYRNESGNTTYTNGLIEIPTFA